VTRDSGGNERVVAIDGVIHPERLGQGREAAKRTLDAGGQGERLGLASPDADALFTVAEVLVTPVGLGSRVRLPGGSLGVVVSRATRSTLVDPWWVVKMRQGVFVTASERALDPLS